MFWPGPQHRLPQLVCVRGSLGGRRGNPYLEDSPSVTISRALGASTRLQGRWALVPLSTSSAPTLLAEHLCLETPVQMSESEK